MSYVPPIGARVQLVDSPKTSNWSRINVGRFARVVALHVYSSAWSLAQGPHVLVKIEPETVEKHDGKHVGPWSVSPCQVEQVT